jgi:solute carrier family 66 (lysosomal lysine-arginine transporter), member 1
MGLLCQIYYYRQTPPVHLSTPEPDESTRLLPSSQMELPAQRPRYRRLLAQLAPYSLGILFVLTIGAAAYLINTDQRQNHSGCTKVGKREDLLEWKSQLFGWVSAVLYCEWRLRDRACYHLFRCSPYTVGSRIPQICTICVA